MAVSNFKDDDFQIDVKRSDARIELDWKGSLHSSHPEEILDPFFDSLLDDLKSSGASLQCDFTGLEYMNSASIPPLIQLLRRLAESEIHGEFVYDTTRKVQTASFRALDVIASKSEYTKVRGV